MRVLIELVHIAAGLAAGLAITMAAAWSYPLGRSVIWWCGGAAMVAGVALGIGPLRRARIADREGRKEHR